MVDWKSMILQAETKITQNTLDQHLAGQGGGPLWTLFPVPSPYLYTCRTSMIIIKQGITLEKYLELFVLIFCLCGIQYSNFPLKVIHPTVWLCILGWTAKEASPYNFSMLISSACSASGRSIVSLRQVSMCLNLFQFYLSGLLNSVMRKAMSFCVSGHYLSWKE